MWIYFVYAILLVLVVYLSIKLADLVDLLDKKTKISGAFIGGVLLAGVTSLPELFTSISATLFVKTPELVVGNILGSDIFNLTVLAILMLIFYKNLGQSKLNNSHYISMICLLLQYACVAYALFAPSNLQPMLGSFNALSLILLGLYIISVWKQPKVEEDSQQQTDSKLSVKAIGVLFALCAVTLIGVSIAITYATDAIADKLNLGKTVAGSILLGVATSLPEVVSTFALCKKKNFDAGFANIIGSNVFNFLVLVITDAIYLGGAIYIVNSDSQQLTIFGMLSIAFMLTAMLIKIKTKIFEKKNGFWLILPLSLAVVTCYLLVFIM